VEHVKQIKLIKSTFISIVFIAIGWQGVLLLLFAAASLIDYITGSKVAKSKGTWTSSEARAGRNRKAGTFIAIATAGILDMVIMTLMVNFPFIQFSFQYPLIFFVLSLVWYTFTELGSIIENVGLLGARVPGFLTKGIKVLKGKVETTAEELIGKEEREEQ
jgi:toxin secretion/phage lysis holin